MSLNGLTPQRALMELAGIEPEEGKLNIATWQFALSTILENGGGGDGLEFESGTWTPESDTDKYTIEFQNTHDVAPWFYVVCDASGNLSESTSNIYVEYTNHHQLIGEPYYSAANTPLYGVVFYGYLNNGTYFISNVKLTTPFTDPSNTSSGNSRFWATETGIYAYTANNSRKWIANRTYKWFAIWCPES